MPLADTAATALACQVAPSTIRGWAMRGWLTQHGTTRRRMYDLDQATRLAERRRDPMTHMTLTLPEGHLEAWDDGPPIKWSDDVGHYAIQPRQFRLNGKPISEEEANAILAANLPDPGAPPRRTTPTT